MVVSDDFVYLHLHKCAGTFVDELLPQMFPSAVWNGAPHDSARHIPQKHTEKPIFSTIRNPWDWWVSWYARAMEGFGGAQFLSEDGTLEGFWRNVFSSRELVGRELRLDEVNDLDIGVYTYRFVKRYFRDPEAAIRDWDYNYIRENLGDLMYPIHFCRVENLRNEMLIFFDALGLELTNKQRNLLMGSPATNTSEHESPATYFNAETADMVSEKDRLIVDLFAYSPPWEAF